MPYGLLAAAVGRSLAEALVKNAAGCIPTGEPDEHAADAEDDVAAGAMDGVVVGDTSAFLGALRSAIDPAFLTSSFSSVVAASITLDDAFVAADALRLKSTSSMGWNVREDRPQLTEVSSEVADAWANESEELLQLVRSSALREPQGERTEKVGLEATLAPIRLAKELGAPLWTDERAVRVLARSEGVPSFGTLSLIRALVATAAISLDARTDAELQMLRSGMVDFEIPQERVLELAEAEAWSGQRAGLYLSRASSWADPAQALELYRRGIVGTVASDAPALQQWAFAGAVGSARRAANPCAIPAVVVVSGLAALDMDPQHLPARSGGIARVSGPAS